jgi:predicted AAA+ superfamily ATPase
MRSLARNITTTAHMATLCADIAGGGESVSVKTVAVYLNALRRIFVLEDLPAWNPALRTSPQRHFVDPSIATAVLRASAGSLLDDFNTFGFLFESLCIRDLRICAQALDGEVFHYQDKNGLEADAVVCLKDGRWGAVEIKMGARKIDLAAKNLQAFHSKVNTKKMSEPSFLMVVTATEHAYRRADGVLVVPLGCLAP